VIELPRGQLAWDAYLLFAPGIEWDEAPPPPSFWMHQLYRGPPEKRFDAARLAAAVEKLLTTRREPQP
jgi:hypothetical protein